MRWPVSEPQYPRPRRYGASQNPACSVWSKLHTEQIICGTDLCGGSGVVRPVTVQRITILPTGYEEVFVRVFVRRRREVFWISPFMAAPGSGYMRAGRPHFRAIAPPLGTASFSSDQPTPSAAGAIPARRAPFPVWPGFRNSSAPSATGKPLQSYPSWRAPP